MQSVTPASEPSRIPSRSLVPLLGRVAGLWLASSWCYYVLVDWLGLESGYDDAPILFACYYLLCSAVAVAVFYKTLARYITPTRVLGHVMALLPVFLFYWAYIVLFLPLLPEVSERRAPPNPPEFMFASAWYYLPKSADILFQQILIAAMVLSAARAKFGLPKISLAMAIFFGGFHLMLIFNGFTSLYVARFTVAATLFGMLVPWLYLRTKHGFRWAYGLHWSFYALDAAITHLVLAVPPWY